MPYQNLQEISDLGCFGCGQNCGCKGLKSSAVGWLGEFAATGEFSDAEREMIASEAEKFVGSKSKAGIRQVNQLTDRIFFARYPDRNGKLIDPKTEPNLAQEWKDIKSRLVLPILESIDSNAKGKEAMYAGEYRRAIRFFDRARRVSIAPALNRARATFNLGAANFQAKRFASAIGYSEIVRTFPGTSKDLERLRAKAQSLFVKAKEEYSKAVPTT